MSERITCAACHTTMDDVDAEGRDNYCSDCSMDRTGTRGPKGQIFDFVCADCCTCDAEISEQEIEATLGDLHAVGATNVLEAITRSPLTLGIPDDAWAAAGTEDDRTAVLLASIDILGQGHHLWALAIHHADETACACFSAEDIRDGILPPIGVQHAADPLQEEWLVNLCDSFAGGDPYGSVAISGRNYLLFMEPHSR